jgi:tetratricopeptide (TPR) repeat protein
MSRRARDAVVTAMPPPESRRSGWPVAAASCALVAAAAWLPVRWPSPCPTFAQQRQASRSQPQTQPDESPAYVTPSPSKSVEVGNFYLRRKNYRGALSRFEEAISTDPDYAPGYLGLGKVCEKLDLKQRALTAYQRYLDLLPSDRDAEEAKDVHQAINRLEHELGQDEAKNPDSVKAVPR